MEAAVAGGAPKGTGTGGSRRRSRWEAKSSACYDSAVLSLYNHKETMLPELPMLCPIRWTASLGLGFRFNLHLHLHQHVYLHRH